jgi:hypothetical protein
LVNHEEYESLEPSTQAHYVADGREYRLRSHPGEDRSLKISMIVLGILAGSSSLLGAYGFATDRWTLEILTFCAAMPTLFGFLVQLAMFFSSD